MPLFSIITPTYNRSELLPLMIQSVLKQTFTDWELIIVDDGSTDNTVDLMKGYVSDARIKYVRKHNSGAAHSRNVGAENAEGEFVTFLDSDDEVKETWLEIVSQKIEEGSGMICVGAMRRFSDSTTVLEKPHLLRLFSQSFNVKFTAGSLFVKRDIFKAVGGYDIELQSNHHTDLGYRLLMHWKSNPFIIASINEYLVQINIHQGARIRTNWHKVSSGTLAFVGKHLEFLQEHEPSFLSNSYAVIAHSFYKISDKSNALSFTAKAIKYRPFYLKNYLRFIKYLAS